MVSSAGPLNEELHCNICLDVFIDPVSTPCGHNFCKMCLKKCWDSRHDYSCPICKESFNQKPNLKVNTTLRDIVDHYKKKNNLKIPPVLCDICTDTKRKALKSCPACQSSFFFKKAVFVAIVMLFFRVFFLLSSGLDVTLDPDTAHPDLILSEDGKKVRHGNIKQYCPDYDKRFNKYMIVLGNKGFSSGRFYFEVQVKGKTQWSLGVARESINRKGVLNLCPESGNWTLWQSNAKEYKACESSPVSLSLNVKLQKVGVFVDYEEGLVSFYDVESRSHIYSFTGQFFTDKLYPFLSPWTNDAGKNSAPLIISPVNYSE
uniref:Bloodthirsty-related gene family, member 9 n=1 Tax=Cyprinus carpio TaxID=7962 RepID=A0A8C2EAL1_CYPCA